MTMYRILQGDVIEQLRAQPANSVHCVITSPPYWGLRRYGESSDEIGREPTLAAYVTHMVEVFREFRRVLRPDGVLFINIGDSYANDTKWGGATGGKHVAGLHGDTGVGRERRHSGLKPKDRCLIPQRLIIALQDDGWWVRDEIIWHKPNGMPFSGTDRTTPAHEPIYMLTKSARYFYDHIAIQEPAKASSIERLGQNINAQAGSARANGGEKSNGAMKAVQFGGSKYRDGHTKSGNEWNPSRAYSFKRTTKEADVPEQQARQHREDRDNTLYNITANKRSVWTVATGAFSEAHFATFPPDLIEPMVLAGTSERGCCPTCGAPFRRVIDRTFIPQGDVSLDKGMRGAGDQKPMDETNGWQNFPRGTTDARTAGWYPTCRCTGTPPLRDLPDDDGDAELGINSSREKALSAARDLPAVPCIVMDPFNGAGTTGLVALQHGRRYLGIELYPEYVEMTHRRLAGVQPKLIGETL